ncbi:MAG: serine hydrolase domain-containing protein [Bacteroidia bacterium]
MRKSILLPAFGLLFNLAFAQQKDDKKLFAEFDKMLSEQYKTNETGATALVARNGKIIFHKAFGMANLEYNIPMKVDNVFRIGSITKPFTAIAILQLMEQGKLSLYDDITKFIVDYPTNGHKITIEHLLTHTSGIPDFPSMKGYEKIETLNMTPSELIDFFKNKPMEFAPGTKWSYSNSGYFLLGYIIEIVSGKTYPQYVEENFFKPLGMTNSLFGSDTKIVKNRAGAYVKDSTGFVNAPYLNMNQAYSSGAIQSTVEDLFLWYKAVHAFKLVKKESLDKAFSNHKLTNGTETDYGYGWILRDIQGSPTIGHSGSIDGFISQSIYLPREDVFVAVFSNCNCNSSTAIGSKIAALAIEKPFEYKEINIENELLKGYTGVYENESGQQVLITLVENQLYFKYPWKSKDKIKAYQKDKFFFENLVTTIEFSRNTRGDVEKLTVKNHTPRQNYYKTNKPIPIESENK